MDTTVKSGGDFAKQFLAPSWDMLSRYRSGGGEIEYTLAFLKKLDDNKETIVNMFTGFIDKFAIRDIILGCYCAGGKFCHRHLLSRFLLENIPFLEPGGELNNGSFEMVEGFNPVILTFDEFAENLEEACKQLLGNEYTIVPNTALPDGERATDALTQAMKAVARGDGPILDKTGVVRGVNDPSVEIITVTTEEEVRKHFFKRWPMPAPDKPERRFTEWMDELYRQCLP